MTLWKYLESKIKKEPVPGKERGKPHEIFLKRYDSFKKLLDMNNSVLEQIADMEGKLSERFPIKRKEIKENTGRIAGEVKAIIDELNTLSGGKYSALYDRFTSLNAQIESLIYPQREIPVSALTIPLHEITKTMTEIVGGKIANLGELKNRLRMPTPDGFAISAFAFRMFMEHNQLLPKIQGIFPETESERPEAIDDLCRELQSLILKAEIPYELEKAMSAAYEELCRRTGKKVNVSVRSSALQEDGEASFAGQYVTFLNVPPEHILRRYKEVVASLFSPSVLFYYKTRDFQGSDMVMPVGVLEMVDAEAGGVLYTQDPNVPEADALIISVVRGLGKSLVEGTVSPEIYKVSRNTLGIRERTISEQRHMLVNSPEGGVEEVFLSPGVRGRFCLKDEQVQDLARYALSVESYYGHPQDIEWVLTVDGGLSIVQTRPLATQLTEAKMRVPAFIEGYPILIDKGIIACTGVGFGKAYIVKENDDLRSFPEDAVLVAKHTSARYVTVMDRASAIVTDAGAATVHMASLAREYQVPAIVNTEKATRILAPGQEITVDAVNGIIYKGIVTELVAFAEAGKPPFKGTHGLTMLDNILKLVAPLHLINPEDISFRPEYCETFHDITRFAHQKAMQEMFMLSEEVPGDIHAARLYAGIPLRIYVIDLGGGKEDIPEKRKLLPEHIRSLPFQSFLQGLTGVEWPEPRHVDVRGFFGMIAHTASLPETELEQMGEKSFLFISQKYMNFSIRLGYHLSVVEAYTGDSINDNYIRIFFKGGGADLERRLRRVAVIRKLLELLDFAVDIREDILNARITKYKSSDLEKKLEILGKMTAYTKQLDAMLSDEESADFYLQEFVKEHME